MHLHVLFSADAKSMGTRTASSSFYFLLKCFSQHNVQSAELLIYASMVSVYWALTEASAPV